MGEIMLEPAKRFNFASIKIVAVAAAAIAAFVMFMLSYFTIEQYEQGVVTRFGKIVEVAGPGLHFKIPFVHSVTVYRTDVLSVQPDAAVNTYTIDNQEVDIVFNVFYRIPAGKVDYIYEHVQDYKMRLYQLAVDRLKSEMGKVNTQHVAEQRGKIREGIKNVLAADATKIGLEVVDFQLTNIEYSKSFRAAVEAAAAARATVETREQERQQAIKVADKARIVAEGEANARIEEARGASEATLLNAKAEASAIRMKGEAEAASIMAQAKALQENSKLVELRKAEKWDGQLPKQLLSGVVPFMKFDAPDGR